jgi:tetratricopeptide (TPR) repeat protein
MATVSEETLFVAALEIGDPAKRQAYLDEACLGNPELRRRVEALLRAHGSAGDFLETPPPAPVTFPQGNAHFPPGTVLDRYRLIEVLGEGGMGTVYLAEQFEPVQRQVALKVIKPGLASPQVLTRFDAERQALALMDHPNIAKVLDAGTTSGGQPYFVMELVCGVPITDYCDERRVHPQARLELFVAVCRAVQHAHQKGIIHRDLKPSNVLVAEYDGKPVPKVIDFGVAKALGHTLPSQTLHSIVGMLVGTLEYMSPEQAHLSPLDVDTRSDVYSLGVMLYELLTGTTPLQRDRLQAAIVDEALRVIREVEPPKPSARLSDLRDSVASISSQRHLEPHHLVKLIRGELDWIVMKSLEKERDRRYESANSFAHDLERYLAHEPVMAGPPSRWYRLRKFVRRNRLAVAAAGMIIFCLIGGVIGTSYGLSQASAARIVAEQRFDIAQHAVGEFLDKVTDDPDLTKAEFSTLRKRLLNSASAFYQRLVEEKPKDYKQRRDRAKALYRLGNIRFAVGEQAEAERVLIEARNELVALAAEQAPPMEQRLLIADVSNSLGMVHGQLGNVSVAQSEFEQAERHYRELADERPGQIDYIRALALVSNNLATFYRRQQLPDKAMSAYTRSRSLYQRMMAERPERLEYRLGYAVLLRHFAGFVQAQKDLDKSEEMIAESRQILERLEIPSKTFDCREEMLQTLSAQGRIYNARGKHAEAKQVLERAVEHGRQLVRDFPSHIRPRSILGSACNNLYITHLRTMNTVAALQALEEACRLHESLVKDQPLVAEYAIELGGSYCNIGVLLTAQNEDAKAYPWFDKAETTLEKGLRLGGFTDQGHEYMRTVCSNRSVLLEKEGRLAEATQQAERATKFSSTMKRNNSRFWHAMLLARTDQIEKGIAEITQITTADKVRPGDLILASLVCSLATEYAKDSREAVRRYSEQGRTLLRRAREQWSLSQMKDFCKQDKAAVWAGERTQLHKGWLAELEESEASPK